MLFNMVGSLQDWLSSSWERLGFSCFSGESGWHIWETNVIHQVGVALKIDAFTQIPLAIVLVLTSSLNGAGDTKWP
jgi:Na+-driven multidrug efflux pump